MKRIIIEVRAYYRLDSDVRARWTKLGRIQGLLERVMGLWSARRSLQVAEAVATRMPIRYVRKMLE